MDKFDQMVEAIEETEDMVECKECFDLFSKADCTKIEHGYLCPMCGRGSSHDSGDVSSNDITTDLYDHDFPDVMEYDPEFKTQVDEKRPDYDIDTMVDLLVKDEYDAISSYETADEVIQHAAGDEEIKDDLLDTIEHIKEEEEEHIEELNAAAGRVEAKEEVEEEADNTLTEAFEDELPEVMDIVDSDPLVETKVGKIQSGADKLSNKIKGAVRKITKAGVNLEEIFTKGFYLYFREAAKGQYTDSAGKDLHMRKLTGKLKDAEIVAKNASKLHPKAYVQLMATKVDIEDPSVEKILQKHLTKQGWVLATYRAGSVQTNNIEAINKDLKKIELANRNLAGSGDENMLDIDQVLQEKRNELGSLKPKASYTPESYAKYEAAYKEIVKELEAFDDPEKLQEYDVATKRAEAEKLLEEKSGLGDFDSEDPEAKIENLRTKALEIIGEKADSAKYTPESYAKYSPNYDKAVDTVKKSTSEGHLNALIRDLPNYMEKLNALLKANPSGTTGEDEDIPEEESVEDLKKAALGTMGEKKAADAYTEESYAAYSKKFDAAINYINKQTTVEGLKKYDFAKLKSKYEALLEEKPADEDIPEEDSETANMDELKTKAKEDLGSKKDAEPYTEESYTKYSEGFDRIVAAIDAADTSEKLEAVKVAENKTKIESWLVEKDASGDDASGEDESEDLEKLKSDLADKIMDQAASAEDKEKYTEESCNTYDEAIIALAEELEPINTVEAFRDFESKVDSRIEELRKNLVAKSGDEEEDSETEEKEEVSGKLKYTNKGKPREALGDVDSPEYKAWGFPEKVTYNSVVQKEWKNLVGILKKLVAGSGAKHTGDLQRLADTLGKFLDANSSRFIFEAFKRKLIRECGISEDQKEVLNEQLSKLNGKSLKESEEFPEDDVECTWCHDIFDKSECRYEVDLGWLCSRCEAAIKSRGETLTFKENNYWDFLDEGTETPEVTEDLKTTDDAVSEMQNTTSALRSAATGIKHMTQAMHEEYHKYANPAELKAMEDLEAVIETAKTHTLRSVAAWGIQMDESDAQGWMSSENEYCYQIMVDYEGVDPDEEEDLQDQIKNIFENEVLNNYKLPAEISDITCSVMIPDPDIAYDDFDDEELQSSSRGSILVYVTFARNLF